MVLTRFILQGVNVECRGMIDFMPDMLVVDLDNK